MDADDDNAEAPDVLDVEPMNDKNDDEVDDRLEDDEDEAAQRKAALAGQTYLTPVEVHKHMRMLMENERDVLLYLMGKTANETEAAAGSSPIDMFFFECLAVPPSRYRPISQLKDQKFENSQTIHLSKLVQQNIELKEMLTELLASEPAQPNGDGASFDPNIVEKMASSNYKFFSRVVRLVVVIKKFFICLDKEILF